MICVQQILLQTIFKKELKNYEPDDEKSYMKPVEKEPEEEDLDIATTIKSKKGLGKMKKRTGRIVIKLQENFQQ